MAKYPSSPVMQRLLSRQKAKKSTSLKETPKPKKEKKDGSDKG